jgi:hypothetical protein
VVLALLLVPPVRARVHIDGVETARNDSLLLCSLRTQGLPDPSSRATLESGLPSSIVLAFRVLDQSGDEVAQARTEVRIEPDLWEGIFTLRTPLAQRRAETLEQVEAALARLGPLPVYPLAALPPQSPLRLQVQMAIHPLAPREVERVRALFGEDAVEEGGRREVSVGVGTLLRYFLGKSPGENWVAAVTSDTFRCAGLPAEP